MAVVGVLTVDLVANTAQFSGDLGKAEASAKDFGKGAAEAGEDVDFSMKEARGSLMLMGDEFGIRLPREIRTMIAEVPGIGIALESLLPIMGAVFAVKLITEWIEAHKKAQEELAAGWVNFGTVAQNSLNALDVKILEAGIRADELAGNHLAALEKQLLLIDRTSMDSLVREFDIVNKAADALFENMKSHWYNLESATGGAKHALTDFKAQYDALLAQGKDKEAGDLLAGTLESAKKTQALMQSAINNSDRSQQRDAILALEQINKGKDQNIKLSKDDLDAQRLVVETLSQQVTAQEKLNILKKAQQEEAGQKATNAIGEDADKAFKQQAEEAKQAAEQADKAWEESYKAAVSKLQENERAKIEATRAGTQERLAVIDAAIKEEQSKGLQDTAFYKGLVNEKIQTLQKEAEDEAKLRQSMADNTLKDEEQTAKEQFKVAEENAKFRLAMNNETAKAAAQQEVNAAKALAAAEVSALDERIKALDKFDKDYLKKLQEFENQKEQITKQGENQVIQIQNAALVKQTQELTQAENKMGQVIASTAAKSILENKNMGQAIEKVAAEMLQSAVTNLLELETVQGRKKLGDAKTAAADAYAWAGNPILGAVLAAGAFTAVMAFEQGGEIPGSGPVPIIGHGGETVVTKALTDQVKNNTGGGGGHTLHYAPSISAVDSDGVERMLKQHSAVFMKEFKSAIRKQHLRG